MAKVSPERFLELLRSSGVAADEGFDAALKKAGIDQQNLREASELSEKLTEAGMISRWQGEYALRDLPKPVRFLVLLGKSDLCSDNALEKALAEVSEQRDRLPSDLDDLASCLVQKKILTRWQADHVKRGKYKGFKLGRYRLLSQIGAGGMSTVYLAEHMLMHHQVAIKVLPRNRVHDSSYLERFRLEARAAASLHHKNIVRAIDYDHEGDNHFFIMEFVPGRSLQRMVKDDGPMDFEDAADYIAQAAAGLQHAHDRGMVHRDVKPANLLVDPEGTVKILDLGLAKVDTGDGPSLTVAHDENVLGTADYLSPEQAINSHSVDHRADIYSLGCTLYFLLTGHPPFRDGSLPQRLMKHQTETPPSIYEDRPDAPQGLVNICSRMMVKVPDGRFQTAEEIQEALTAWLVNPSLVTVGGSSAENMATQLPTSDSSVVGPRPRKQLKTRPPQPQRQRDTVAVSDSDTFKLNTKKPRTRDSSQMKVPAAAAPSAKHSGSGSSKRLGRAAAAARSASSTTRSGGDFNFEAISSEQHSTAEAMSQRRAARGPDAPWWIWVLLGISVVVVLVLMYFVIASA